MTYTRIYHTDIALRGDGAAIKLTKVKGEFRKGERIQLIPGTTFDYALASEVAEAIANPPVVVPPVVTPPASDTDIAQNDDGSVYLRKGATILGLNFSGAIGSYEPVPEGWRRSRYSSGAERATAGLQIDGTEFMQANAVFQGAMIVQGATKVRQHNAITTADVLRGVNDGPHWRGASAGVRVLQAVALAGGGVRYQVELVNTGTAPIARYDWWGDFNPGDQNAVMSATATETRQGNIALRSGDPRAFFYVTPVFDPRPATILPIKTVLQAPKAMDRSIAVGFLLNIAPGSSDVVTFEVVYDPR